MPKRTDIKKILIIGSGAIIIGQACEFDYSGTQACKALKEEGYEITLVNSNPATIMTDPDFADQTYIEPITADTVELVIDKERPDALLPTLGGQTALNVSVELAESGVLDKYSVELIGAKLPAIQKAEDRALFKDAMVKIGLEVPRSGIAHTVQEALALVQEIGFPAIIRPAFTLGGTGGGIAYNIEEYEKMVTAGLALSPISELLIEESVIGWKEFELEVMRDGADNVVIICSIENVDAMGVHTGDSITVAPIQTLTDKEYQLMRDSAIKIIREIGVDTGGSNIQFAVDPKTGKQVVIEMNPRVSRSSALASKATGFPIAKIAAKLAVGYNLDEIPNDITAETPACFEPTIDYVVVKIPRWAFEKFQGTDETLTTQMKSVGEAMAIGRTFKEALQKGLRSLETGWFGLDNHPLDELPLSELSSKLSVPNVKRIFYIKVALAHGMSIEEIHAYTHIDPFFLYNLKEIVDFERTLSAPDARQQIKEVTSNRRGEVSSSARVGQPEPYGNYKLVTDNLKKAKQYGFSDRQLGDIYEVSEEAIRECRKALGIEATFKTVDTCAAEFEAETPYYYSTCSSEDEVRPSDKRKIMILGGGPNRIGQGIEFDYCCVHAALALKTDGYETIMVNSNPETVSTDYDTSDRLYFEPLTREDVLNIYHKEKPIGVIVQFGGQTPLNLAIALRDAGVPIIGTSPEDIARSEDRQLFKAVLDDIGLMQSPNGTATSSEEAAPIAAALGYPVIVRPSYVLGGRAMQIVYDEELLHEYMNSAVEASPEHPVLIDKYLEEAIEVDVDAISDGNLTVIGGIMEHIEEAGIHSGDSDCVLPPYTLVDEQIEQLKTFTYDLAKALRVRGLMNVQYAIKNDEIYVLEVNPRASRTVPFVSKAIGVPLAKLAARVMAGKTLEELGFTREIEPVYFSVKVPVFPFNRFPGSNTRLGPEMKSTGEVMGIDTDVSRAFAKAQKACGYTLPLSGKVFISVKNKDKRAIIFIAKKLTDMGFELIATHGTAKVLLRNGMEPELVFSIGKGRPTIHDYIKNHAVDLIINTPTGDLHRPNELLIREMAIAHDIPIFSTIPGAAAAVNAIDALQRGDITVTPLQDYFQML
ncbi:carbamoyl-phosphate synthase large subunit [Candidatus Poribacteria bacterium]|nr:carbamoyl-phosphate synthase large subunit [Candidatus Poribacteria bacterium]MYH81299.1 carbamoyl-phosphate synthase large subunit [Candidatus Poribacteria bacterium]MYK92778.1 carbamoyl-phosphate synthase large subunit [Candidatus Poribacteria bacterium]